VNAPRSFERALDRMPPTAAPPRQNGELVFEAPWQGRVFGMALALAERGAYPWDVFRDRLIAEIQGGAPDADDTLPPAEVYYRHWLAALEALLVDRELLDPADIEGFRRSLSVTDHT
jgi:nitrile hydratase accessory protein